MKITETKVVSLLFTFCFFCLMAQGQTIFFEDFNEGIPLSLNTYDEDGLAPNQSMISMGFSKGKAWIAQVEASNKKNKFAASMSKYEASGTSNDWLIMPAVRINAPGTYLEWKGMSSSKHSRGGYKIVIATNGSSPSDFTSVPVFQTEEEPADQWTDHHYCLDHYIGQEIYIAFVNNSTDKYIVGIDDISIGIPKQISELRSATDSIVCSTNELIIKGRITANYAQPITHFTASYASNGNKVIQKFPDVHIAPLESYEFTFDQKLSAPIGDTLRYQISANIDSEQHCVNAQTVNYAFIPKRMIVIEEGTGTWCGNCPSGFIAMDYLHKKYPDEFIGIAVHNADPMTVKNYDNGLYSLGIGGYPIGFINRNYSSLPLGFDRTPGNGGFETWLLKAKEEVTEANIKLTATYTDETKSQVSLRTETHFALNLPQAQYNLAYVVKECNVKGSGSKYNQTNTYAGNTTPMGGFEKLPASIPAADMIYQDVARTIQPSFKGEKNAINKKIQASEIVTNEYMLTLPITIAKIEHVEFIALLIETPSGKIVNAGQVVITPHEHEEMAVLLPISETSRDYHSIQTYRDGDFLLTQIETDQPALVSVQLYGTEGSCVSKLYSCFAEQVGSFELPVSGLHGIYILKITIGNKILARKVVL